MSGLTAAPAKKPVIDVFTASDTWEKPSGYPENHIITAYVWGAGGGGGQYYGGTGGACTVLTIPLSFLPDSCPIIIGAGGTSTNDGGSSSFAGIVGKGGLGSASNLTSIGPESGSGPAGNGGSTGNAQDGTSIIGGSGGTGGNTVGSVFGGLSGQSPGGGGPKGHTGGNGEVRLVY